VYVFFYSLFISLLPFKIQLLTLTGLTSPHICGCSKPGPVFALLILVELLTIIVYTFFKIATSHQKDYCWQIVTQ